MFKQVLNKIFGSSDKTTSNRLNLSDSPVRNKAPIYSIPTVSPFQSIQTDSNFDLNVNTNTTSSQQQFTTKNTTSNKKQVASSKYTESHTRQIYIAPHCIRYSNSTLDDTVYRIDDESLSEIATEILESDNSPPKLQIVFYDGRYFAINNSHLQIYKQLQLSGLITHVQADVISLEAIPLALRQHLLQQPCLNNSITNSNDTISDEEFDDMIDVASNNISNSSSSAISSTNGLVEILSADILTPASIEMISKQMLVDETYEFGACENCVDTDDEDIEEVHERNKIDIEDQEEESVNTVLDEKEIIKNIKKDYEWKKYENFCSSSFKMKQDENKENIKKKKVLRRQSSDDKIIHQSEEEVELRNLIS
ncbi:unnamed protein product [Brachionus calyciflorus]|uniref:Uncharacterized protein n=1 Tax=Brachionus calyciflorus TaxID=104777 RepID=A0A813TZX8_9BILA|nr:unnamed protein product [Brachionus calyciflorus]